ncbi:HNH endonuclease [Natronomonas marina]|jgi:hypothetical protein|uniref:HNH endonuclease n=1 Tax=Natronomonas marina TaxID=2961939 RepID=UPI0020C94B19|nr:HNH endonuclease [Natronomonas marina]
MSLEPRAERRRTRDGEGPRWEALREAAIERDGWVCQRCGHEAGADAGRELEVHHTVPFSAPSMEALDELVTLCEPCHATLHADDPAYGDRKADAPLFPDPDAPPAVATMRSDRQHVCQRCQHVADSAAELAAYTQDDREYVVCKPCAGALLSAGYDPERFEAAGELDAEVLVDRAAEAPVRPALLASGPVRAVRPPRTTTERVVYDTPLRYALNPIGVVILFSALGILLSFLLF